MELIQGMTEDDADWSVIHLNNWLWSKIEEIKGERYDTNKYEIVSISAGALSPSDLIAQRQLLAAHMKESMKPGVHYGEIPGCGDKPALFKAGAEYLLLFSI